MENGKFKKDAPEAQLYDLQADVNQTKNVIRENTQLVEQMKLKLELYRPDKPAAKKTMRVF